MAIGGSSCRNRDSLTRFDRGQSRYATCLCVYVCGSSGTCSISPGDKVLVHHALMSLAMTCEKILLAFFFLLLIFSSRDVPLNDLGVFCNAYSLQLTPSDLIMVIFPSKLIIKNLAIVKFRFEPKPAIILIFFLSKLCITNFLSR